MNHSVDDGGAAQMVQWMTVIGGSARIIRSDVSNLDATRARFDAAQALGGVRAVVDNAAIIGDLIAPLVEVPSATIRDVRQGHVAGVLSICQVAQRRISTSTVGSGGNVNISSNAGTDESAHTTRTRRRAGRGWRCAPVAAQR